MWEKWKKFYSENKKAIKTGIIIGLLFMLLSGVYNSRQSAAEYDLIDEMKYTDFIKAVKAGKVDTIYYSNSTEWMVVTFYNKDTKGKTRKELEDYEYSAEDKRKVLNPGYEEFRKDMLEYDTNLVIQDNSTLVSVVANVISIAIPILWIYLIFKLIGGQFQGMNEKDLVQTSEVKFSNVIGQDEILDDVKFVAELIKNHEIGSEVGAQVPKGMLLAGEPGTGKTLIAKAIAGEANVPFLYVNSSSMIEMFVGVGAKRVRDVFKVARKNAPCIVFFDEIDSIGCKRDKVNSSSENDQTINALLQEMDGFNGREGIFIIAATNRASALDPALTRAGRFDRQINVNRPRDWHVRNELFKYYLEKFSVLDTVDTETLAKQCTGFTGADVAAVCNEASIVAVMHKKAAIDMDCIEEAIDKKVFNGNRTKEEHFKEDKKIVAYHEAGHAIMSYLLGEPIARASIISNTSGVGGVVFNEESDTALQTQEDYENRVMILYAGRASEYIKFDKITTGASNDIEVATHVLTDYVTRLGFSDNFGLLNLDVLMESKYVDKSNAFTLIQDRAKELYSKSLSLLEKRYSLVEALASALLEYETLNGNEIKELLESVDNTDKEKEDGDFWTGSLEEE